MVYPTNSPAISIVIPIYNCEKYLDTCLESLFNQSLRDLEYIFIDDCSTDNSYSRLHEILLRYPSKSHQVKVIKMAENIGISSVRNYGLKIATGDYIGWVDADDWIDLKMFETLYNKAQEDEADIVWCDFYNVYTDRYQYVNQDIKEDSFSCIKAMLNSDMFGGMCNKLYRRNLFSKFDINFPTNLNMCEDLRVNVQLFHLVSKLSYAKIAGYYYVKYKNDSLSTSQTKLDKINIEWIENVKFIVEFVSEKYPKIKKIDLDKFKLEPKKNLLVHGRSLNSYKKWKEIFSESNYSIYYSDYPVYYKFLGFCIANNIFFFVRIWIALKYKLYVR